MSEQLFALAEEWRKDHTHSMGVSSIHPRDLENDSNQTYKRLVCGDTHPEKALALYYQVSRQRSGYTFSLSQEAGNGGDQLSDNSAYIDFQSRWGDREIILQSHRRIHYARADAHNISDVLLTRQLCFTQPSQGPLVLSDTRCFTQYPDQLDPPFDVAVSATFSMPGEHLPARLETISVYTDTSRLGQLLDPRWQAYFDDNLSHTIAPNSQRELVTYGLSTEVPSLSLTTNTTPYRIHTEFLPPWNINQWVDQLRPDAAMNLQLRYPGTPMSIVIE